MRRIPLSIWAFALPFVLLGLAAILFAGWQVARHVQSLSWQSVPATLLALQRGTLAPDRDSTLSQRTANRLAGRYSYTVDGKEYLGERLSFSYGMENNFDDWWQEVREVLGSAGDTFDAWVNPRDPADSVAFRAIRWGEVGFLLLGGLAFSCGGLALLFGAAGKAGHKHPAGTVSWPLVGCMWLIGAPCVMLAWLLWVDEHPVWAGVALLPLLLALNGTVVGLKQRLRR